MENSRARESRGVDNGEGSAVQKAHLKDLGRYRANVLVLGTSIKRPRDDDAVSRIGIVHVQVHRDWGFFHADTFCIDIFATKQSYSLVKWEMRILLIIFGFV